MRINLIEVQIALYQNDKEKLKELRRTLGARMTDVYISINKVNRAIQEIEDNE